MLGDPLVWGDHTMTKLYAVVCDGYVKLFNEESEAQDYAHVADEVCGKNHRIIPILTSQEAA